MKNGLKIGFAVLCLGAAAFFFFRNFTAAQEDPDLAGSRTFQCAASGCGEIFDLTLRQYKDAMLHSPDGVVKCPKCGSAMTTQVFKCPACSKPLPVGPHGVRPKVCEHCGAKQPPALG